MPCCWRGSGGGRDAATGEAGSAATPATGSEVAGRRAVVAEASGGAFSDNSSCSDAAARMVLSPGTRGRGVRRPPALLLEGRVGERNGPSGEAGGGTEGWGSVSCRRGGGTRMPGDTSAEPVTAGKGNSGPRMRSASSAAADLPRGETPSAGAPTGPPTAAGALEPSPWTRPRGERACANARVDVDAGVTGTRQGVCASSAVGATAASADDDAAGGDSASTVSSASRGGGSDKGAGLSSAASSSGSSGSGTVAASGTIAGRASLGGDAKRCVDWAALLAREVAA